uniref:G_PROTEIN_RECEP_F1_2 domain-containing protein n=1 Tax=Rhabditophanes sp. KR3021 TaxID=114890 RepID=A0AC35TG25_9BILA
MHVSSAISVYCWLTLSIMRFYAVKCPIKYRLMWKEPQMALIGVVLACATLESWILVTVKYFQHSCDDSSDKPLLATFFHLSDLILMLIIPSLARLILDMTVFISVYFSLPGNSFTKNNKSTISTLDSLELRIKRMSCVETNLELKGADLQINETFVIRSDKYAKNRNSIFFRAIIISAINLMLNMPAILQRFLVTIDYGHNQNAILDALGSHYENIAQLLYFSQFACNALYLSTTIYETMGQGSAI